MDDISTRGVHADIHSPSGHLNFLRKVWGLFKIVIVWVPLLVLNLWAVSALYVDYRIASFRTALVFLYLAVLVLVFAKMVRYRALGWLICGCSVLIWWFTLKPTGNENWRPDVARTAWSETLDGQITVHNVRNCDYRSETEYTDCWSDRTFNFSDLRGVDFFFTNWGVRWIGHPIISFDFGNHHHLAFSIEARYKKGQTYSAILGFFRQYELIFIAADERDLIRLRTNYRKDEEVFMYHMDVSKDVAQKFLLTYLTYLNQLRDHPEWYNALTKNCTTTLTSQLSSDLPGAKHWTYKFLLNGSLDEVLYSRGRFVTGGLPFEPLKAREHINPLAHTVGQSPDFSELIRVGRIGF